MIHGLHKKWLYWHTLVNSGETKIYMRYVYPWDVKKILVQSPISVLEEVSGQPSTNKKS